MKNIRNLVLAAMFLAIGYILPFFTGQIREIGNMLLPMHIPVLLCGLICGWQYGLIVGFVMPLTRSVIFGMPVLYPSAFAMAFELAAYGGIIGYLYAHARWQFVVSLYRCMLTAMLGGRIVWGVVMICCLGIGNGGFTFGAFLAGAFVNAVPGIVLQLVLIPSIMLALDRSHLVRFRKHNGLN